MGSKRGRGAVIRAGLRHGIEAMERRVLLSAAATPAVPSESNVIVPVFSKQFTPFEAGSASPSGYTPTQVRDAYGVNAITLSGGANATGTGQTIAIIDSYDYPTAASDLQAFDAAFGLPAPPSFVKVNQNGSTSSLPPTDPNAATDGDVDQLEESLDIEWAHAIAPGANIVLFEANSDLLSDSITAIDSARDYPGVSAVSMSFGTDEFSGETSLDSNFTTPAGHTGITFIASAGDTGKFIDDSPTVGAIYPAASPNVVAVGGTTLFLNGNTYANESAWGNGQLSYDPDEGGGGGGGVSAFEPQPAYQATDASSFSLTQRTYPDVSLLADPSTGVPIYNSGAFGASTPWAPTEFGGTSLAAPLFAGMISVANQLRAAKGLDTLDGPTQTLPDLYKFTTSDYHDITVGNNGFQAGVGYDLASGIGSPIASLLLPELANNGIGHLVFNDSNADGIQDSGDAGGVAGVTVELLSVGADGTVGTSDDVLIATTTTNSAGIYQLPSPATSGNYYVHFVLPAGYTFSPEHATGSNTNDDSDADANGNTGVLALTPDSAITNIDAGMYQTAVVINSVSLPEGNSGLTPFVFTVTLSPPSRTAVSVAYTTADGTATAGSDYIAQSGTITFAPGQTQATITIEVIGDTVPENNETFRVILTEPTGYVGGTLIGVGTIINDDFPTASVSNVTATRLDSLSQNFGFVVTLNETAPFAVSVPYFTADNTAVASIDYQAASGTLIIPAGQTTGTINVVVFGGVIPQNNKVFLLTINAPPNVSSTLTDVSAQGVGTIVTNFPPGISIADSSLAEPLTSAVATMPFVVSVEPSQTTVTTITYATADGTAVAGVDYGAISGTLTFAPGQVQQTVYVPIYRRFVAAASLTFTVNIAAPGSALPLYRTAATGTIVDPGTVALAFSGRKRATYTDLLNNPVAVSLRGPGSGEVVFIGSSAAATNAYEILLDGTSGASTLVISTRGGTQTPFQNIVSTSALGGISGRGTNLLGTLDVAGSLNSLQLGFLQGATLTIGAGSGSLAINVGRALDTTINSAIPIASITADAYLSTNGTPATITAPSVGPIRVKEAFSGTVVHAATVASVTAGQLSDVSLLAAQSIGVVTADTITGSTFFAGVEDGLTLLPTSAADFISHTSSIAAVHVKAKQTDAFSDTRIAGWSIGTVKLGSVAVADGGTPFGVTGGRIASVTTTAAHPVHLVAVSSTTPSLVDDDFTVDGL